MIWTELNIVDPSVKTYIYALDIFFREQVSVSIFLVNKFRDASPT